MGAWTILTYFGCKGGRFQGLGGLRAGMWPAGSWLKKWLLGKLVCKGV